MVYIDISSEFRDRIEFPVQSEFIVNINKVLKDGNNISYGYPIYNFSGSKFGNISLFKNVFTCMIGNNNSYGYGNVLLGNILLNMTNIQPDISNSSSCDGYFDGCIIKFYDNGIMTPATEVLSKNIISYIGKKRKCMINGISVNIPINNTVNIFNISNGSNASDPFVKILGGENIFNFYIDYYLEDITIFKKYNNISQRFKLIVKYENNSRDALLESSFPIDWKVSDSYKIRKNPPLVQSYGKNLINDIPWAYDEFGQFCNAGIGKYSNIKGIRDVDIYNKGHNFNSKSYYKTEYGNDGPIIYIKEVNKNGGIESFNLVFPGIITLDIGDILDLEPIENSGKIKISEISQMIDISPSLQGDSYGVIGNIIQENDKYNNYFVNIPVCGPEYNARINEKCPTKDKYKCVDPVYYRQFPLNTKEESGCGVINKSLFMSEEVANELNFEGDNLKNWGFLYTSCFKDKYTVYDNNCATTEVKFVDFIYEQDWEILDNNGDLTGNLGNNYSSLGLTTSKCYNLNATSLILPNVYLKNGGLISLYPSIYMEIYNLGSKVSNKFITHNENLKKAVFKFAVTNIPNPIQSKFIKLSSSQTQSMQFNINDNIYVKILLGNGELFITSTSDNDLPSEVNHLLQLSMTIGVE